MYEVADGERTPETQLPYVAAAANCARRRLCGLLVVEKYTVRGEPATTLDGKTDEIVAEGGELVAGHALSLVSLHVFEHHVQRVSNVHTSCDAWSLHESNQKHE